MPKRVYFKERSGDEPFQRVTEGVSRQVSGKGRRTCTRVEKWFGERAEPFAWQDLPENVFDASVWKHTRWLLPSGRLFDEAFDELEPWDTHDNQGTLRVTFVGQEHALHRVVAFFFANRKLPSGRFLTWAEFNQQRAGGHVYEVDHADGEHANSVVANLKVLPKNEHMRKDGRIS